VECLPGVNGVQIGIVQKIHDDPQGESQDFGRPPNDFPFWRCRMGTSGHILCHGGGWKLLSIRKSEMRCLLAFINDDPRYPIIIGSVHSKKHMPAYTPDGPNTYKAITTNSKMKIEFEDVKKIITIWTPAGNQIVISDEDKSITILDETANKMVMDPKGITWHTPKDFKLTADGLIDIKATKTISIQATQDLTIKGMNVTSQAQVAITMKGATAEVNGSGMTTIKGGMVMIN
jgi:uncharacterized protein involved in type VI secretion and phage assembly